MLDLYVNIKNKPAVFRQFNCGESLISMYNCPIEKKFEDVWSQHNYIVYVVEGRKVWHTAEGSYDLQKGSCVFVKKGAVVVEQFFDVSFCLIIFFLPDDFIADVLKNKFSFTGSTDKKHSTIMPVDTSGLVHSFFQSMISYFDSIPQPDTSLLELKFRELVLTLASTNNNAELLSFFKSLLQQPASVSLQRVMNDNFYFNLKLEEFAKLSNRSLSAFKRDFHKIYNTTPGKWLAEKRLTYALHLLTNVKRTVVEAAYESGFENASHFSRNFRQRFGISPATVKQSVL